MSTGPQPSPRVSFGPFAFHPHSGDLTKFGLRIRLQGQPLQILSILTQRPGQVVTREELQQRLWQGTTFVDFERGLNTAVNKLRQTLGDSADQPRYIETVTGRGYRFVAPIQASAPRAVIEIARPQEKVAPGRKRVPVLALSLAVVVAAAGLLLWGFRERDAPPPPHVTFTIAPPEGFELEGASSRQAFAVSPDGARIVFTAMDRGGAFHVFVRNLRELETQELPNSAGAHTVFWGSDSGELFFTQKGQLYRSPIAGDARQAIGHAPAFLFMGTASPSFLILSTRNEGIRIPTAGGDHTILDASYRWPQMLPDGKHILFVEFDSRQGRYLIRVAEPGRPASARTIADADSRALFTRSVRNRDKAFLLYIRNGTLLAHPFDADRLAVTGNPAPVASGVYSFRPTGAADFSISDRGVLAYQKTAPRSQLEWVDRAGQSLAAFGPGPTSVKAGYISPDRKHIAAAIYDVERGAQTIWVFDAATGEGRVLDGGDGVRDSPNWSPDSKQLAYLCASGAARSICIRGLNAQDEEQVLPPGGMRVPTDWSPDGRFLVFSDTAFVRFPNEARGDLFVADLREAPARVVALTQTPFHESFARLSPDGRWMAFTSNESGQTEVYVQAFSTAEGPRLSGPRFRASKHGALTIRWRADGKELFYLGLDGKVYAAAVTLGEAPRFGPPQPLFEISTEARAAVHSNIGFDVTPDGRRFLIPVIRGGERLGIVVVQNWEAGLKN